MKHPIQRERYNQLFDSNASSIRSILFSNPADVSLDDLIGLLYNREQLLALNGSPVEINVATLLRAWRGEEIIGPHVEYGIAKYGINFYLLINKIQKCVIMQRIHVITSQTDGAAISNQLINLLSLLRGQAELMKVYGNGIGRSTHTLLRGFRGEEISDDDMDDGVRVCGDNFIKVIHIIKKKKMMNEIEQFIEAVISRASKRLATNLAAGKAVLDDVSYEKSLVELKELIDLVVLCKGTKNRLSIMHDCIWRAFYTPNFGLNTYRYKKMREAIKRRGVIKEIQSRHPLFSGLIYTIQFIQNKKHIEAIITADNTADNIEKLKILLYFRRELGRNKELRGCSYDYDCLLSAWESSESQPSSHLAGAAKRYRPIIKRIQAYKAYQTYIALLRDKHDCLGPEELNDLNLQWEQHNQDMTPHEKALILLALQVRQTTEQDFWIKAYNTVDRNALMPTVSAKLSARRDIIKSGCRPLVPTALPAEKSKDKPEDCYVRNRIFIDLLCNNNKIKLEMFALHYAVYCAVESRRKSGREGPITKLCLLALTANYCSGNYAALFKSIAAEESEKIEIDKNLASLSAYVAELNKGSLKKTVRCDLHLTVHEYRYSEEDCTSFGCKT